VMQSGLPRASKDLACRVFELLQPVEDQLVKQTAGRGPAPSAPPAPPAPSAPSGQPGAAPSLGSLMGGTR